MATDREKAARELLAFYREAGVDALLGETPVDRFASADPPPAPKRPADPALIRTEPPAPLRTITANELFGAPSSAPPPPDVAVMAARDAAKTASTLTELRAILDKFEGCALKGGAIGAGSGGRGAGVAAGATSAKRSTGISPTGASTPAS